MSPVKQTMLINRANTLKITLLVWMTCLCLGTTYATAESYDDMIQAVKNDFEGDARELLDKGFDVNTTDPKGNTLVILAAANRATRTLPALLAYHPKLELRNIYGETALMLAAYRREKGMVTALLAAGAKVNSTGWTALHYAASGGDMDIVNQLISAGADINAKAPEGSTPMIMAAREGKIDVIKRLLSLHADPSVMNENGMTALKWSLKRNDTDIMELLVEANATQ